MLSSPVTTSDGIITTASKCCQLARQQLVSFAWSRCHHQQYCWLISSSGNQCHCESTVVRTTCTDNRCCHQNNDGCSAPRVRSRSVAVAVEYRPQHRASGETSITNVVSAAPKSDGVIGRSPAIGCLVHQQHHQHCAVVEPSSYRHHRQHHEAVTSSHQREVSSPEPPLNGVGVCTLE